MKHRIHIDYMNEKPGRVDSLFAETDVIASAMLAMLFAYDPTMMIHRKVEERVGVFADCLPEAFIVISLRTERAPLWSMDEWNKTWGR